ncbi:ankyrin repeat and death domain-containing protein 1A-like isoform X2 [Zootermopsis nevadensis]|uniref:ankyrin repeat and death domain-containing protein 1A-like isoform X2 n=1 Tax=Zootermopsis nevadensis TaxID=136037 RepID=UPI000B8EC404|nr:ankyrin repeat and death domain-containing protein 1A-like isoform X2 [Zootermopsis nevadensis]
MTDDLDSDLEFSSRSKDKNSSVTMLSRTDITVEEDALNHRSSRALKKELQLHEAVIKNDADAVRRVLKEPLDINSRNNYGRAPIHWASSRGNTDIVEMLIAAKCDIEAKDKYGMRPILMAAWHGHKDAVQMLINCGANVLAVNKKHHTLLMCGSRNNRLDVVDFLLDTLEDIKVDAVDLEQQTALYHAALGGHVGIVRRLVEAGAKTESRNKLGRTPLHAACEKGHVEVVEFLLHNDVDLDARDEDGDSPLHTAAENQQTHVVQLLLESGSQPDTESSKGFTPLHVASSKGCRGIIEALVQHGASVNHQSKNGNTPLHVACQANETQSAELLISKGADLNALNVRLQSPIHIAAEQGYTDICKLLLAAGANINQKEQGGKTPLYIAARGSFTAIVDMIIKTARLDYPAPVRSGQDEGVVITAACRIPAHPNTTQHYQHYQHTPGSRVEDEDGTENNLNVLNTARRKWRHSESRGSTSGTTQHDANERLRELLFRVAYKQLADGDWKNLAHHWAFTAEQIRAIEHQYTGPYSYKEHGFRMLLIWVHGLGPEVNPVKELYESLASIGKKGVADALRKKLDEENQGKYKGKRRCNACSIT